MQSKLGISQRLRLGPGYLAFASSRPLLRTHQRQARALRVISKAKLHDDDYEPSPIAEKINTGLPYWQSKVADAAESFQALTGQQKAWVVAAALGFIIAIPRAIVLVVIAVERLVVGSLLATEAIIATLLLRAGMLAALVGTVGLLLWGIYAFAFPSKGK